ncbi:hypothetical protein MSPP1_001010 [Malassezia sp. CBS 17886]|nr:hypothetical protein MSPP1_001010 [Malassezia sp. CBS 17886]
MPPEGDVWSGLLRAAARTRHTAVRKTIVVLGEPGSGKSTIVRSLAGGDASGAEAPLPQESAGPLGYGYVDLGDDHGTEEARLRASVYLAHSSDAAMRETLPYAFPPVQTRDDADTAPSALLGGLRNALFILTLDWRDPGAFVVQLLSWLRLVAWLVRNAHGGGSWNTEDMDADDIRAQMGAAVEAHFQTYREPAGDDDEIARPPALADLPLSAGALTENLGVPLVIVVTKADTLGSMVRERHISDAQLDYVQQVLRTVALAYGASIFSTSQGRPVSMEVLRSYIRARLYAPDSGPASPFPHRAETVDPASLLVPAGWDSWDKIQVVDEQFDCGAFAAAWHAGVSVGDTAPPPGSTCGASDPGGAVDAPSRVAAQYAERIPRGDAAEVRSPGACTDCETRVVDEVVVVEDEATFLARLQREQDDSDAAATETETYTTPSRTALGPSVHTSALDMPSVGEALEQQRSAHLPATPRPKFAHEALAAETESAASPSVTTPQQTEVLHTFFQSPPGTPGGSRTPRRPVSRRTGTSP